MPGVRYGPDITDDAADALEQLTKLRKQLRAATNPKRKTMLQNKIKAIDNYVNDVFGGRRNAQRMSRYSLTKQGYASDEYLRNVKASKFRKRKGPGQLGLAESPEGKQGIGRKKGYRAREAVDEADRELYKSATRAGRKAGRGSQATRLAAARKERKKKTDAQAKARAKKARKAAKKAAPRKKAAASTSRRPNVAKKASAARKATAPKKSR